MPELVQATCHNIFAQKVFGVGLKGVFWYLKTKGILQALEERTVYSKYSLSGFQAHVLTSI